MEYYVIHKIDNNVCATFNRNARQFIGSGTLHKTKITRNTFKRSVLINLKDILFFFTHHLTFRNKLTDVLIITTFIFIVRALSFLLFI